MKRNMEKIAAESKVNPNYDITLGELRRLFAKAKQGNDGLYEAITTAFDFGYAQGLKAEKA